MIRLLVLVLIAFGWKPAMAAAPVLPEAVPAREIERSLILPLGRSEVGGAASGAWSKGTWRAASSDLRFRHGVADGWEVSATGNVHAIGHRVVGTWGWGGGDLEVGVTRRLVDREPPRWSIAWSGTVSAPLGGREWMFDPSRAAPSMSWGVWGARTELALKKEWSPFAVTTGLAGEVRAPGALAGVDTRWWGGAGLEAHVRIAWQVGSLVVEPGCLMGWVGASLVWSSSQPASRVLGSQGGWARPSLRVAVALTREVDLSMSVERGWFGPERGMGPLSSPTIAGWSRAKGGIDLRF